MRDREGNNFLINLLLAPNELEKLNDSPYYECYTMRILLVSNIKSCGATLNFASKEREIHIVRSYKEELVTRKEFTNVERKLLRLII
jgi:hypothetical protein